MKIGADLKIKVLLTADTVGYQNQMKKRSNNV